MATPDNWEQFNEDMRQWQQQAQDLALTYRGLVDVAESGELGALAFIESLSEAPIGNLSALQQALQIANVVNRAVTGAGALMAEGASGLGGIGVLLPGGDADQIVTSGFYRLGSADSNAFPGKISGDTIIASMASSSYGMVIGGGRSGSMHVRFKNVTWSNWFSALDSSNTTVDSNGFIKAASPIFRLANTATPALADESQFTAAGAGAANSEAPDVTATHDGVGVYTIHGSLGFATEGWTVEVPQCINGNRMVFVETEQADDGTITVRTFKPKPDLETLTFVAGEPMDIPDDRWIDLRLSMPEPEQPDEPEPEPGQTDPNDAA
ncbi:phage tail fiber protein [Halomonas sp. 86]|uniref:phage tail fiber protein n=1 Tax=unclassified Halomonas TaxID=2609666 RepID=UPI0040341633